MDNQEEYKKRHLEELTPKAVENFKDIAFVPMNYYAGKNGIVHFGLDCWGNYVVKHSLSIQKVEDKTFKYTDCQKAIDKYKELITNK